MSQQQYNEERPPQRRPQMFDQDADAEVREPRRQESRAQARPPVRRQENRSAPPVRREAPRAAPPPRKAQPRAAASDGMRPRKAGVPARRRRPKGCAVVAVLLILAVAVTGVFSLINGYMNRIDGTVGEQGVLPEEGKTAEEFEGDHVSFLICGLDYDNEGANGYNSSAKIGRTDMVLYVYYNIKENKLRVMQVPRDTYVGDELSTGGTGRMNGLYFHAKDTSNRMAALSTVFNDQFRLPVDFYVTIDLDALKEIVAVQGYIEVYVPMDIEDPENTSRLEQGWRRLTPDQVEFLLRNRTSPGYNDQGDLARLRTQQSFYSALFREFTQLTPRDLAMWMEVFTYRCKTDADLVMLGRLATKALSLQGEDVLLARPACGWVPAYGVVSLVEADMAEMLNQYFRPEGQSYTAAELNMHTLPIPESIGVSPTEIKTMADIQATEPAA